ncbi:hypothetical protein [Rhodanobacter ginsenosidimutans]|uniref:Superoxide dismutase n=1 Tax=Rhodanobacter ginsenosidimutans TaxID=490571 RepID=A0ABW0JTS0_9GAMM
MRSCRFLLPTLPGCLLAPMAMAALAQSPAPATPSPATAAHVAVPVSTDGFGPSVTSATLATMRGGTDVVENMHLHGTVDNNSADHVASGYNTISGGAFTGAAGVPMVIQNSGNNVLIQNATIINVQFQP